jgi:hypothetical protein
VRSSGKRSIASHLIRTAGHPVGRRAGTLFTYTSAFYPINRHGTARHASVSSPWTRGVAGWVVTSHDPCVPPVHNTPAKLARNSRRLDECLRPRVTRRRPWTCVSSKARAVSSEVALDRSSSATREHDRERTERRGVGGGDSVIAATPP